MSGNKSTIEGGWAGSGCKNSAMSLFSQLFHSKPTAIPQLPVNPPLASMQDDFRVLRLEVSRLREEFEELTEKTSRKLKRYAAWAQPRKDGKFGPQEPADGSNGSTLIQGYGAVPTPTHAQIEAMARERSLLK